MRIIRMKKAAPFQRVAGEPRSDCGEPVIDLAVEGERLQVVIWRFGRDFEPSDEHRMCLRDLIDEALESDRLSDGSLDPDGAVQDLLRALEAEVEHLRREITVAS
jgi:hypothetical protein